MEQTRIEHLRQNPKEPTCGAVCLKMIFKHIGIDISVEEIYKNISDAEMLGIRVCKNILMLRYLLDLGFQTCVVSVRRLKKVLDICSENNINVIFNQRAKLEPFSSGHYVLYLNRDDKFVYVNDPLEKSGGTPVKISKLKKLLDPSECFDIPEKNTLILINAREKLDTIDYVCKDYYENPVTVKCFKCIDGYVRKIICPTHDHFIDIRDFM